MEILKSVVNRTTVFMLPVLLSKAACGIYFSLVGQMDLPDDTKPLRKSACRMLKALAMQSWTQPLRNNEMDRDIVRWNVFVIMYGG